MYVGLKKKTQAKSLVECMEFAYEYNSSDSSHIIIEIFIPSQLFGYVHVGFTIMSFLSRRNGGSPNGSWFRTPVSEIYGRHLQLLVV